jgi:hypothetical protein
MYLQSIDDASDKVADLLEAAEYFQITGLNEICLQMLIETIKGTFSQKIVCKIADIAVNYRYTVV